MASKLITDLSDSMRVKTMEFLSQCKSNGLDVVIYCTLRSLQEQAKLYRQSRTLAEIQAKMAKFNERGLGFLAKILHDVGPCLGPHVTNACCGESWHNYAEAFDGIPVINGKLDWNIHQSYWIRYGECARKAGLYWAGDWTSFKEYPHCQSKQGSNPLKVYTPEQIQEILKKNKLI